MTYNVLIERLLFIMDVGFKTKAEIFSHSENQTNVCTNVLFNILTSDGNSRFQF